MEYRYRPAVLDLLWRHGIRPGPVTSPELVREFVNDLYRYELRRLRDRLVRKEIPRAGYCDRVAAVRLRYPLLSLKTHQWLD